MIDPDERVLLFSDRDPGVPDVSWWITPGGGVEAGESDVAAAVREVGEETGLVLDPAQLIGPIAVRPHVWHGYSDVVIEQEDVFFAALVDLFTVDVRGHTEEEKITMTDHRWWSAEELQDTDETVWPATLLRMWDSLPDFPAGRCTTAYGDVIDESTVPPALGWSGRSAGR